MVITGVTYDIRGQNLPTVPFTTSVYSACVCLSYTHYVGKYSLSHTEEIRIVTLSVTKLIEYCCSHFFNTLHQINHLNGKFY